MTETALRQTLDRYIAKCGNQSKAAVALKISPQYLSDILKGFRPVPDVVLGKLGYKRETRLVRLAHDKESA